MTKYLNWILKITCGDQKKMAGYSSFTVHLITLPVAYSTYTGISKNLKD
jgi:hypothetical protein